MRVILATTNGSGMGHLARQSAIGLALQRLGHDPVLFSLSTALPQALGLQESPRLPSDPAPTTSWPQNLSSKTTGLRGEYCLSPTSGWMPRRTWEHYYAQRLDLLITHTKARVVVFDGVVPYPGLLRVRARRSEVAFVWCRRGMWQQGLSTWSLRAQPFFDAVIEPGDFASAADAGATATQTHTAHTPVHRVAPVSLTSVITAVPRDQAATALGLIPDQPTALVTLPFAAVEGIEAAIACLLDSGWQVALTQGPIGASTTLGHEHTQGRLVRLNAVFPLARYVKGFDAVLCAAGYNAVHEFLPAGLATALIPRAHTRTDDQLTRAQWLAQQGLAESAPDDDPAAVAKAVSALADPARRRELQARTQQLPAADGAQQAAQIIQDVVGSFSGHHLDLAQRGLLLALRGRDTAEAAVGTAGMQRLRELTGRRQAAPATQRDAAARQLAPQLTDTANGAELAALLASGAPIEHLLPGSPSDYHEHRQTLATWWHNAVQ